MEVRTKNTFPSYSAAIGDADKIRELSANVQLPAHSQQPDTDLKSRNSLEDRMFNLIGFIALREPRHHNLLKNAINMFTEFSRDPEHPVTFQISEYSELRELFRKFGIPRIYAVDSPNQNGLWLYIHMSDLNGLDYQTLKDKVNLFMKITCQQINQVLKKKPAAEVPPQYRHL